MNRVELGNKIKDSAKAKEINITDVRIFDRGDRLDVNLRYVADCPCHWVHKFSLEDIVANEMPVERSWKMQSMDIDRDYDIFQMDEEVEMYEPWIKLAFNEDEKTVPIKTGSGCGQYRQGWLTGKIIGTPATMDRGVYVIGFDRTVWLEPEKSEWIGDVTRLEQMIKEGTLKEVAAGDPVYIGSSRPEIRSINCKVKQEVM